MYRNYITCQVASPNNVTRDMRFPTMWYVRLAKPQISLRIRAVWSEPLLVAWIFNECWAIDSTSFGVSKLKIRLHMLVRVDTCQKATLLESSFVTCTCTGLNRVLRKRKVRRSVWVLSGYGISCRAEIYRHTMYRLYYFYRSFQGGASFVDLFLYLYFTLTLSLLCCLVYSLQPCDHLLIW